MSCGDPDSTIQELCPHKWGQDVSYGYLIRMWQLVLELLFHYSPMAISLHLCFPLGRSGDCPWWCAAFSFRDLGLPRTGLSSTASPSSSDLLCSFSDISSTSVWALGLIWNGLGYQILWAHNSPSKPCCLASRTERRVLMSSGFHHGLSSLVLRECQGLFACPRHALGVSVYKACIHWCFYKAARI